MPGPNLAFPSQNIATPQSSVVRPIVTTIVARSTPKSVGDPEKAAETAPTTVPMATTEISCVAITCSGNGAEIGRGYGQHRRHEENEAGDHRNRTGQVAARQKRSVANAQNDNKDPTNKSGGQDRR